MSDERPLLHIIDGYGYVFRAYYAIRALSTASGEPTNAVYGFTTMIQRVLDEERPEYIAMAFDAGAKTFRNDIYPEYKANRPPLPEDLRPQLPRIREVTEAFRIPVFQVPGYEADDLIATLTRTARAAGFDVRLITGDKDLMQLVTEDRVTVWEPMREKRFRPKEVIEKYGVPPELIADQLALAGDTSDNIPGVRGVGMKTAAKLLTAHGDFEGVLAAARAGEIKGKICEKIVNAEEEARLSRRLVALDDEVDIDIDMPGLRYPGPDPDRQRALFEQLEFHRLIARVAAAPAPAGEASAAPSTISHEHYQTVGTPEALSAWVERLGGAKTIAGALETETPRICDTKIYGLAFAEAEGLVSYVPVGHDYEGCPSQLELQDVMRALQPVLEDSSVDKIFGSAKLWYALCASFGIELRAVTVDTSLASYLLDAEGRPTGQGPHTIGDVARKFLELARMDRIELTGRGRDRRPFSAVPVPDATRFVAEAADLALRAAPVLANELKGAELTNVMSDLELPLAPVLADIETTGVRIDVELLNRMKSVFAEEIGRLEQRCYELAGKEFNIGSTPQLRKILFEDLGLKIIKRTKTGPSTDHSVLEELATMHDLPGAIVDYRQVTKLQSTYIEALPKMVSAKSGRVHTVLSQTVAATGRLSSTDPNLQNIPVRTELGRTLRKAFVPAQGNLLISVDYSQIELRVMAHFSGEPVLVDAFSEGEDVHARTASVLFDVPASDVTREQRNQAKTVNFGVLYGMGPVRLARQLGIPRRTASQFIKDYFDRQPKVREFIDSTLDGARERGFVRTLLGRRRWVHDIASKNRGARSAAERVAVNTPIQGSAADLIKLAMIRVHARLRDEFPRAKVLLQVHDELLVEAPEGEASAVAELVKREMESAYPLAVPLVADAHQGSNWDEAH